MIYLDIDKEIFGNQLHTITNKLQQLNRKIDKKSIKELAAVVDSWGILVDMLLVNEVRDPRE